MAECAAVPYNFKSQWPRSDAKGSPLKPQKSFRTNFSRTCKFVSVPPWNVCKSRVLSVATPNVKTLVSGESSFKCNCLRTVMDFESAAASGWVPLIDQLLLTASIFLAYMAGVIPSGRSYDSRKITSTDMLLPGSPVFCKTGKEDQMNGRCAWDVVKTKISDSLLAIENGYIMENNLVEFEQDHAKRPLSLYAVATAPRFRLLLSSIEELEKEVNKIPDTSEIIERDKWLGWFSSVTKKACQSALVSWMEQENCVADCRPDKELLLCISEKLKGDDVILGSIRKSGKMELYADLIGFLRYGYFRECSYYDHNIYPVHGAAILEDLIINLADAMASMYLELISVDSDISEKISNSGLSLCTLSTRALQKLRNEVAMWQWIHQNFGEIVLMYEDRFDLRVLKIEPCQKPAEKQSENLSWWRRLMLRKSVTMQSSLNYAAVSLFPLTLKRTRELRALKGWRYYYSLLLELSDIAMPMIKAIIAQFRNAISFFLVSLIGRSVGLVYSGIRQSLQWK